VDPRCSTVPAGAGFRSSWASTLPLVSNTWKCAGAGWVMKAAFALHHYPSSHRRKKSAESADTPAFKAKGQSPAHRRRRLPPLPPPPNPLQFFAALRLCVETPLGTGPYVPPRSTPTSRLPPPCALAPSRLCAFALNPAFQAPRDLLGPPPATVLPPGSRSQIVISSW